MSAPYVTVIAEAGVNHNGSLKRALDLVDAAAEAGADMVKFQTFKASKLVSERTPKAAYQLRNTGIPTSQLEMLRSLELSVSDHEALLERCRERSIRFLSTPFDSDSLSLLAEGFGLPTIKIGSGELTNGPLLLQAARTGRKLIVSTGMSTLEEVAEALAVLAFGYRSEGKPTRTAFAAAMESEVARSALRANITLLHCTTEYPTPFDQVNLFAMKTLADAFCLPVGFSDHTEGTNAAMAAVALGACVIEKHFTLDRRLPGPDHKASIEPDELAAMVRGIREVTQALGDGMKRPRDVERANIAVARKVLVAARNVARGTVILPEDVSVLRSGTGRSPMDYWDLVGSLALRDFAQGENFE